MEKEFRVFTTNEFDEDYNKLDKSKKIRVEKILNQIKNQNNIVGKPLGGLSFFREKKFNGSRIYYLYYEELKAVLVISISDKKTQQATINKILQDLDKYQEYIYKTIKEKIN